MNYNDPNVIKQLLGQGLTTESPNGGNPDSEGPENPRKQAAPMVLYHVTTGKKAKLYRSGLQIASPVRGFDSLIGAMAWAIKTGRKVIYEIRPLVQPQLLPDHHNEFGNAWWTESVPVERIKCVFSGEEAWERPLGSEALESSRLEDDDNGMSHSEAVRRIGKPAIVDNRENARLKEIIKIAHHLGWIGAGNTYPLMQLSEVEKCMIAMVDDFELGRFREWYKHPMQPTWDGSKQKGWPWSAACAQSAPVDKAVPEKIKSYVNNATARVEEHDQKLIAKNAYFSTHLKRTGDFIEPADY